MRENIKDQLTTNVVGVMETIEKNGFEVFTVGGGVRDALLGTTISDWDLTTNATPEAIQQIFEHTFYNNEYGTVSVKWQGEVGEDIFEITPYRSEGEYLDGRRPSQVTWGKTLQEDVLRRDFTINALAANKNGEIIDLVGGMQDLQKGILKAVGNADERFSEDALRMMRAIRFCATFGFMLEQKTFNAIRRDANLIAQISKERVRDELLKLICAKYSADGVLLAHNLGILNVILPEVHFAFGVSQKSPNRHHEYDVGTHLVETLRCCRSTDPITRFACLLHDIGKVPTRREDPETGMVTFYNHEVVGANMCVAIAKRFKLSNVDSERLVTLVRSHMFTVNENQTDTALRRFIRQVGKDNLDNILALRTADRLGSGAKLTSWRTELFKKRLEEVQVIPFEVKDMAIGGEDVIEILKLKPGPRVGQILAEIFAKVDTGELKNDRGMLLLELERYQA